jgi:hypothetical protein
MKTVITSEGNFLLASVGYYETAITRPFLNHCSLKRREEHRKDCVELYGIEEYWNRTFGEGEFQCYDVGHDIGINNPYAVEILNSDILINN